MTLLISSALFAAKIDSKLTTAKDYYCGTGSTTVNSDCWSASYSVTVCGDFAGQAEATVAASLAADQKRRSLIALVQILNELDPC